MTLFYYQTIPREILHLVNYEPTKIDEGPKMTLIRPRPLIKIHLLNLIIKFQDQDYNIFHEYKKKM